MTRNRIALASAAVTALLAAGCGTTVSGVDAAKASAGTSTLTAPNGASSGDSGLTVPAGGSTASGVAGTVPGTSGTSTTTSTGTASTTSGTVATGTTPQVGNAPGVTDKSIYVGIDYTTNADAANAAIGASGITSGDEKADAQAVIDDINAHGGAAGRKLVPVWHGTDAQSQQTKATQDQEMCTDFTQDHHVFAATALGYTDNFLSCLTKANVLDIFSGDIINPDKAEFQQFPYYIDAGTITQDRAYAALVKSLVRQNYFTGWNPTVGKAGPNPVKIGVLGVDVPQWTRPLKSVLLPALKAAGHPVSSADVRMIYNPGSTTEDSITLRDIANAALKFRQDGVTHVILLDTGGQLLTFFGKDAQSQHYYPRYGVHSGSGLQAIYDAGLVTNDQLNGAVGFAWNPGLDLSASAADKYQTAATKHCLQVMKQRTGQTYTSTNAAALALSYCDELYLLADAINRAGSVINLQTVMTAIEATHFSFQSAGLASTYFGPGRHDGVETGWDQKWDTSCKCNKYVTQPYRIP